MFPPPESIPAMFTRSPQGALGVEVRVLVQGDLPPRMLVAENVAAMPAMVASLEEAEGFVADGVIADWGGGVGFPVLACGRAGDGREVGVLEGDCLFVFGEFSQGARGLSLDVRGTPA